MTTRGEAVPRSARAAAAIGASIAIVSAIGAVGLRVLDPVPVVPNPLGFGDLALVGFEVMGVSFASVGALLAIRRPGNAVGWLMIAIGIGQAGSGLGAAVTYSAVAVGTPGALELARHVLWGTGLLTTVGAAIFPLALIFPTGQFHGRIWKWAGAGVVTLGVLAPTALAFQPGPFYLAPSLTNPFGFGPDLRAAVGSSDAPFITASIVPVVTVIGLAFTSRYRSADRVERVQLKWFMLASVVSILGIFAAAGSAALRDGTPGEAGLAMFGFGGALVPVAIGIAILRHGLYDIDRLIGRTLAYGVVTAVLTAVFGGTVLALTGLLASVAGGETIAVAASTLVVFGLFQPLRSRAQKTLDRRFDRERYDAERTLDALAERLRSDMDLQSIGLDVVGVLGGTFRPSGVGIWIRSTVTDGRGHGSS